MTQLTFFARIDVTSDTAVEQACTKRYDVEAFTYAEIKLLEYVLNDRDSGVRQHFRGKGKTFVKLRYAGNNVCVFRAL